MPPVKSNKFKTSRFPAARIKRIMQLDEEVGKLASATPVMISKSLECFIQVLLDEACKQVRAGGSRKLTASHLKQMINTNENFDFLRELVDSVPDVAAPEPKAPSKSRKPSAVSTDGTAAKKRGKKPAAAVEAAGPAGAGAGDDEMEEEGDEEDEYDGESKPDVKPSSGGGYAYPPAAGSSGSAGGSGGVGGWGEGGARGPVIGSWKKDMTGGGGTGEGGKGCLMIMRRMRMIIRVVRAWGGGERDGVLHISDV